jgi:hypothetical protein
MGDLGYRMLEYCYSGLPKPEKAQSVPDQPGQGTAEACACAQSMQEAAQSPKNAAIN